MKEIDIRYKKIISFINAFTLKGNLKDVITCFTSGCCFWFALILESHFSCEEDYFYENSMIYYDSIMNHFGYYDEVTNKVFDITGDVTDKYNWEPWSDFIMKDSSQTSRIIRDCINLENRYLDWEQK